MELCRLTGEWLAQLAKYSSPSMVQLSERAAREDFIKAIETRFQTCLQRLLDPASRPSSAIRVLYMIAGFDLGRDASLCEVSQRIFPDVPRDVAVGLAMRYYAGFLEMAKMYREKAAQGNGLPDRAISDKGRSSRRRLSDSATARRAQCLADHVSKSRKRSLTMSEMR